MAKTLRVREPGKHAILNPDSGLHEVPDPAAQYPTDHPLVKAAPWAFATEEQIAQERAERESVTSVRIGDVEQATSAPGEKRSVRRGRGKSVGDDVVEGASKSEPVAPTPELQKQVNQPESEEDEGGKKEQHPITVTPQGAKNAEEL